MSAALNVWETEGGRVPAVPAVEPSERPASLPELPPGYSAQEAWGFHAPGGLSYDFSRVYGPPEGHGPGGPICHLDEGLSYWVVVWHAPGDGGEEHATGQWMSYAQARKLSASRLTFRRFASPLDMREQLPLLLRVRELGVTP